MHPVWHFVNGVPQIGPLTIAPDAVTSTAPIRIGTAAALTGALNLENAAWIRGRNQAGNGDVNIIRVGTDNRLEIATDVMFTATSIPTGFGNTYDFGSAAVPFRTFYAGTSFVAPGANGQMLIHAQQLTELTTVAAAATTDTTIQMPATSVILGVSVRVTTVIPTAATFTVGDSGSAARFSTAAVSTAATSTDPGTKAGAYYNASALSVRITPNATPAANTGRVRVTIYYYTVTPPTS